MYDRTNLKIKTSVSPLHSYIQVVASYIDALFKGRNLLFLTDVRLARNFQILTELRSNASLFTIIDNLYLFAAYLQLTCKNYGPSGSTYSIA